MSVELSQEHDSPWGELSKPEHLLPYLNKAHLLFSYKGKGHTSAQEITVEMYSHKMGSGITFLLPHKGALVELSATASNVVNTLRNVVIGLGRARLCIVEHFLCACALWGIDDVLVLVDGPEVPLADGSSQIWIELFEQAGIVRKTPAQSDLSLPHLLEVASGDRTILAIPAPAFSATYMMDWDHPKIGRVWKTWDLTQPIEDIYRARTFGTMAEQAMLGLACDVVCLTEEGFSQPLRFNDEPVRHKLLDLIGDLMLCGINPLRLKARFISIKGGHELDVQMARQISQVLESQS
jgi:UDP-3-O-[3-hydroxymyristoyl] N-acetylglucosamine deacetylase